MSLATTFQSLDADASATLTQALTAKLRAITGEEDQTDILVRDAGNTPPDAVHRLRHGSPALHTPPTATRHTNHYPAVSYHKSRDEYLAMSDQWRRHHRVSALLCGAAFRVGPARTTSSVLWTRGRPSGR